jgi:hypothetical protein
MNTTNFLAVIKSVKLSKSGNTYVLSTKTDNNEEKVIYASKTMGTVTIKSTDDEGNEKPIETQRFATGKVFDFSVKLNKEGEDITDFNGEVVLNEDGTVRKYLADGMSVLSAEEVPFEFFKEMVIMFK